MGEWPPLPPRLELGGITSRLLLPTMVPRIEDGPSQRLPGGPPAWDPAGALLRGRGPSDAVSGAHSCCCPPETLEPGLFGLSLAP